MRKLLIVVALLSMAGCYSLKTATKQVARAGIEYPELIAANCANKFPVVAREGKTDTIYRQADNVDLSDSLSNLRSAYFDLYSAYEDAILQAAGDTSCQKIIKGMQDQLEAYRKKIEKLQKDYKPCKPDTVWLPRTDTIPDLAAIAVRDGQISGLKVDNSNLSQKLKTARKWNLYLGGFILLCGVGTFIKLRYFK